MLSSWDQPQASKDYYICTASYWVSYEGLLILSIYHMITLTLYQLQRTFLILSM